METNRLSLISLLLTLPGLAIVHPFYGYLLMAYSILLAIYLRKYLLLLLQIPVIETVPIPAYEAFVIAITLLSYIRDQNISDGVIYTYRIKPRPHTHLILAGMFVVITYVPLVVYLTLGREGVLMSFRYILAALLLLTIRLVVDYIWYKRNPEREPRITLRLTKHLWYTRFVIVYLALLSAISTIVLDMLSDLPMIPLELNVAILEILRREYLAFTFEEPVYLLLFFLIPLIGTQVFVYQSPKPVHESVLRILKTVGKNELEATEELSKAYAKEYSLDIVKDASIGLVALLPFVAMHFSGLYYVALLLVSLSRVIIRPKEGSDLEEVEHLIEELSSKGLIKPYKVIESRMLPDDPKINRLVDLFEHPFILIPTVVALLSLLSPLFGLIYFWGIEKLPTFYAFFLYVMYSLRRKISSDTMPRVYVV